MHSAAPEASRLHMGRVVRARTPRCRRLFLSELRGVCLVALVCARALSSLVSPFEIKLELKQPQMPQQMAYKPVLRDELIKVGARAWLFM